MGSATDPDPLATQYVNFLKQMALILQDVAHT